MVRLKIQLHLFPNDSITVMSLDKQRELYVHDFGGGEAQPVIPRLKRKVISLHQRCTIQAQSTRVDGHVGSSDVHQGPKLV